MAAALCWGDRQVVGKQSENLRKFEQQIVPQSQCCTHKVVTLELKLSKSLTDFWDSEYHRLATIAGAYNFFHVVIILDSLVAKSEAETAVAMKRTLKRVQEQCILTLFVLNEFSRFSATSSLLFSQLFFKVESDYSLPTTIIYQTCLIHHYLLLLKCRTTTRITAKLHTCIVIRKIQS